ncbi:SAM-dependent methyltransferase [Haloferula sp. BvORR071]|uniref:SAM-dependent methyltransferase n=1 Tax=Haloferula sp. BvORR071 TaxID=1396141 RepID=UPI0006989CD8|nr:SAM-dependent methyltransferase [Haloferula sp. BvORR071]
MSDPALTATSWLLRIPEVFAPQADEILAGLGAVPQKKLGADYHLVRLEEPERLKDSEWAKFISWRLPVHHAWPCNPQKMEGFVEKAAQGIFKKFGQHAPQTLLAGPLQTAAGAHPFYKHLATNLRGRTLQLFPPLPAAAEVESQDPELPTLFCLVGKEGLFCGLVSPREANGFYPGGTKFISQSSGISRAGAKIAEALHYLKLHREIPAEGARWLELGASPGGMSSELLARGYRVTAVDKADLDPKLKGAAGLEFIRMDVDAFRLAENTRFEALLSDMNGDPRGALRQVVRLSNNLVSGGLIVFTIKSAGAETPREMIELSRAALAYARASGLEPIAETHLTYNRQEFTMFFERPRD